MYLIKGTSINEEKLAVEIYYNLEAPENAHKSVENGILVESILPYPSPKRGKSYIHYVNPQTAEQWHEEFDRPLTQEEILEIQSEKIDLLLQMQMAAQNII